MEFHSYKYSKGQMSSQYVQLAFSLPCKQCRQIFGCFSSLTLTWQWCQGYILTVYTDFCLVLASYSYALKLTDRCFVTLNPLDTSLIQFIYFTKNQNSALVILSTKDVYSSVSNYKILFPFQYIPKRTHFSIFRMITLHF